MGVFDRFRRRPSPVAAQSSKPVKKRRYDAAKPSRLYSSWVRSGESPNSVLRMDLPVLRARARDLARNNPHVQRFLKTADRNILGPAGIRLQMRVTNKNGSPDKFANKLIEEEWRKFVRMGVPTMCGTMSFRDAEGMVLASLIRDGAPLIQEVRGAAARNAFGYSLHFMEIDHIDHSFEMTRGESRIQMGVHHDLWNKPLGYWVLTSHPNDYRQGLKREWINAEDIIHFFLRDRVGQVHGVPWLAQGMNRLKMLDGYEEAELVAARAGASKMGFLIDEEGDDYDGDDEDETGIISDFEAGVIEKLPPGYDFKSFDPQHPNSGYESFVSAILRSIAGGLDISYAAFTGDLRQVNFSSIRQGEISDRDAWRVLQGWLIEHFHARVFQNWLKMSLTTGAIDLSYSNLEKYNKPSWQSRGWQWVDPVKDAQANTMQFEQRTKSLSEIAAEQGRDLEEVAGQIMRDIDLLKSMGIDLGSMPGNNQETEDTDNDDEK
jgi:lambda family phage portal protein